MKNLKLNTNIFLFVLMTLFSLSLIQCAGSDNTSTTNENDPDNPTFELTDICTDSDLDGYYTLISELTDSDGNTIDTSSLDSEDYPCLDEGKVDCDDADSSIYPDATEIENDGIDQDCDGEDSGCGTDLTITFYEDSDGDGYGNISGNKTTESYGCDEDAPSAPEGYSSDNTDCDDSSSSIYPGATETDGDGIDQDCDGSDISSSGGSDGDDDPSDICDYSTIYYQDSDGDGYGLSSATKSVGECEDTPSGYVTNSGDCDDTNADVHPGATEVEGNGVDDDCDSSTSDSSCNDTTATYYKDSDGDGYGDSSQSTTETISDCMSEESQAPDGYVTDNTDCDDSDDDIHPGATDTAGNGIDEDCSGSDALSVNTDDLFENIGSRTSSWDSNVIFNGVKYVVSDDKCIQNTNTQLKKMASYIYNINYDSDDYNLTFGLYDFYKHTDGDNEPYDYSMSYTTLHYNQKYLRFFNDRLRITFQKPNHGFWNGETDLASGSTSGIPSTNCDSYNKCTYEAYINLTGDDLRGNSMTESFLSGKHAFVVLQGFSLSHGSTSRKMRDAYVKVTLPGNASSIGDSYSNSVKVQVVVDFNGANTPKYFDAYIYFTIGVYNPDYVTYTTFTDSTSSHLSCSGSSCKGDVSKTLSIKDSMKNMSNISCDDDGCKDTEQQVFVGLRSWGFNLSDHFEVHKVRGFSRLKSFTVDSSSQATVKMDILGEAYKKDCSVTSDSSERKKTNMTKPRAIVCASSNVCKAIYKNVSESNLTTTGSKSGDKTWDAPSSSGRGSRRR